jgi:cytochrome c oxidase assembly factor CtaG
LPDPGWTFDPWITIPLAVVAMAFALGYARLQARAPRGSAALRRRAGAFTAGWVVLALALTSPLHAGGERSFTMHMIEHELIMLVAAWLLVLSRPLGLLLWSLPQRARRAVTVATRSRGARASWQSLTDPFVATALQAAALWAWHAPPLFDRALASPAWHVAQHLSFLVTAILFWWAMTRRPRGVGVAVLCLFVTSIVGGALGALMAFSASPWYAGYAALGLTPQGLAPAEDQQLAGLLMWVPGGLVHAGAALWLLSRWLRLPRAAGRVAVALLGGAVLLGASRPATAATVYVSDEQADVVHVIDGDSLQITGRIAVGRRPRGLGLAPDGARLWVSSETRGTRSILDVVDLEAAFPELPIGQPVSIVFTSDGRRAFVARGRGSRVATLDDPRLRQLRIGVQLVGDDGAKPPPAHALARRGIVHSVRGYMVYGDYGEPQPATRIVAAGEVDAALVWGPLAGWAARRASAPLRRELDAALARRHGEIGALLRAYGVPLLPLGAAPSRAARQD